MCPDARKGHVYLVGAGPGDPGLITLSGQRAIAEADIIYYDALASSALLRHAKPEAKLEFVGKRAGKHALPQGEIEDRLVASARSGKVVVRLKGGDPFVFGRGGEEALRLRQEGVDFTVIPGITSAVAAPAYAGIPVTHRGLANSFMVVTGNEAEDGSDSSVDWGTAARADTLVILMGVARLADNMSTLMKAGRDPATPVALIRWGTRPDQQVVTATVATAAARAAEAGLAAPAVIVVGDVASLAETLDWFRAGPLAGRRVVVTRARGQASRLARILEERGALVVEAPTIETRPRLPNRALREAILARPDWIIWTSATGVDASFAEIEAAGLDARALAGVRVAVIGKATAAAAAHNGLRPDFVPSRATSKALGAEIGDVAGRRVLIAISALADDTLAETLRSRGAEVEQIPAYDTVPVALEGPLLMEVTAADAITFTSASTVHNLRATLGESCLPGEVRLVSIGPRTSRALRESFGRVDAEAAEPTLEGVADAVARVLP